LPSPATVEEVQINVVNVKVISDLPVTSEKVAIETANDPILQIVFKFVFLGWPPRDRFKDNPPIQVHYKVRDQLTIINKCLLFSARVVIPSSLRETVLKSIHQGHPGTVRS
jgi:hypothetical protein